MATYSSVLAWRIPGTGEPVRLPSIGSHRVRHDSSYLEAAAGFPLLHYLPEFAQSHVNWVSDTINHLILCCPFSSCPQPFPVSGSLPVNQIFSLGGQSIRASASALPMNTQEFISLRIDWFDFPAVQGTLKNLLQHCSSKASVLWHSALFMLQLSHLIHNYYKNHCFD